MYSPRFHRLALFAAFCALLVMLPPVVTPAHALVKAGAARLRPGPIDRLKRAAAKAAARAAGAVRSFRRVASRVIRQGVRPLVRPSPFKR
jgi:hypothetical protein